jgi:hypothetical protein
MFTLEPIPFVEDEYGYGRQEKSKAKNDEKRQRMILPGQHNIHAKKSVYGLETW